MRSGPIELDLRGLKCPLPVLRTRKALRRLATGEAATVLCTDPLAAIDIPHLVRSEGHRLDRQTEAGGVITFRVIAGSQADPAPRVKGRVQKPPPRAGP